MSQAEFDLIETYFSACGRKRADVLLGVGDDAALLRAPNGQQLLVTQDTLVSGVHFFADTDPQDLGHKALAVNLSDLAAMGAQPAWVTLGLTLPTIDSDWLAAFSRGFCALADASAVQLVGGDTCQGPLSMSIGAFGWVPDGEALRRDGAQPGDEIYVTGTLGDAGLGLRHLRDGLRLADPLHAQARLQRPTPRLAAGLALRGLASAAIDISDGLTADLGHILSRSGVGASLQLECLPLSALMQGYLAESGDWDLPLTAGDDYELCFTLPPALADRLQAFPCPVQRVGLIEPAPGLRLWRADGSRHALTASGYQHFSGEGA